MDEKSVIIDYFTELSLPYSYETSVIIFDMLNLVLRVY